MNRVKTFQRRAVRVDDSWMKHFRYLGVGVFSGLLNLAVLTTLTVGTDIAGPRWYAAGIGATVGYIGHKLHSYGRGSKFSWMSIPKFIFGVGLNLLLFAVLTGGISRMFDFIPYGIVHFTAMCIGFFFSQQWNLWVVFRKNKRRESIKPDSPAVCVELSK